MSETNVLNFAAPPDGSWATTNLAEALPGVATPLGWGIWAEASDRAARAPFFGMGALDADGLRFPERSEDRVTNLFYGRVAIRVDYFCRMGDLVPGANGEAVARDAFGFVPPNFQSQRSLRRLPQFLAKMPVTFFRQPGRMDALMAETAAWYAREVPRTPGLDLGGARAQYRAAADRFTDAMSMQSTLIACCIQPIYTALSKLATDVGVEPTTLMRGQGSHVESAMIEGLWELSRGRRDEADFLRTQGYQGPDAGEISSRSWREDPTPLRAIVAGYRKRPDTDDPRGLAARANGEREKAEAALLDAVPRAKRGGAKLTLRLARRILPLRSSGKVAYLQHLDVARAAARRCGALLAESGVLADAEDVFYLTQDELLGAPPADVADRVAERRALRSEYEGYELPAHWTGLPPLPVQVAGNGDAGVGVGGNLAGVGVSPGVVEGVAHVVTDPAEAEMEDGEILVAHTTDPSWASVMYLAAGLVVDIGGQLSHAAVVARELGVPCVMGTGDGTRLLRTGDRCRIDGKAGTVEILERAAVA